MAHNDHAHCSCVPDFRLQPLATAAAQQVYFRLSQNPTAVLVVELIELIREKLIREEVRKENFDGNYRSAREIEINRRADEATQAGRRAWRLGFHDQAEQHWQRADKLWIALDRIAEEREIHMAALKMVAKRKKQRGKP